MSKIIIALMILSLTTVLLTGCIKECGDDKTFRNVTIDNITDKYNGIIGKHVSTMKFTNGDYMYLIDDISILDIDKDKELKHIVFAMKDCHYGTYELIGFTYKSSD